MRPLYLEMTAFGSYAKKTEIPFEDLRHNLYLVTGDTGAGKTTIFDAIMFALFGKASGTDRKGDMFHCDLVPKSTDTEVLLRFSQGGKEYTVARKLHFSKKRGAEQQYGDGKLSADLKEPDRAPTEGSEKVSARCEELLGMNAEQFRKIIMLAQGEFKEFLKADSDKKNEILGKLFDNSVYVYYQNLLIGAKDALKQQREKDASQLETLMHASFDLSDLPEEVRENYLPGHPMLVENLERLTEEEQDKLDSLREEQEIIGQIVAALNERKGAAETMNGLLDDLEKERRKLDGLLALDPEMTERRQVFDRVETAFHKAKPAVDAFQQADQRLDDATEEVRKLTDRLQELDRLADAAQKTVDADVKTEKARDEIKRKRDAIAEQIPQYRELADKQKELHAAEQAKEQAASEREEEESKRDLVQEEIRSLKERLEELDQVDAELQKSEYEKKQAEEDLDTLAGEAGIQNELLAIQKLEKQNEREKKNLLALTEKAQQAMGLYSALYQRFIAGQAGLLADDLREALEEKGETVCPVCGSKLSISHLEQLALRPADIPNQAELEEAEEQRNELEAKRTNQVMKVEKTAGSIEMKKEAALQRAKGVLEDCVSWEQLSDPVYYAAAVEKAQEAAAKAKERWTRAKERKEERDRYKKQLPDKEKELKGHIDCIKNHQEQEQKQTRIADKFESAIQEKQEQLLYKDEQEAKAEKDAQEKKLEEISQLLRDHQDALKQAKEDRDNCQGNLKGRREAEQKYKKELSDARSRMEKVLEETGFDSDAAMHQALEPMGEEDGETWLQAEREALDAHENAKNLARSTIEKLGIQTEGRQKVDLTELEQQLETEVRNSKQAAADCSAQEALLKNHKSVLSQVREVRGRLDTSERAWQRLSALAALAGGAASEVGKISFDRYVMGAIFREILEMANRRMELMSDGRYELVHTTSAGRKNAKAGLEIEVLDNITGVQRGSGSLSGGESFFTSLALALGLSDVVQNHAGGKQMDALFIDEGFGTLSSDVLEKALEVLNQLTDGNRLVGIISHVDKLDESIPQKIRVKNSERGSTLTLELT